MTNEQREVIREAYGCLGAAIVSSLPTDDQIIMNQVREAHTLLHTLFFAEVEPARRKSSFCPECNCAPCESPASCRRKARLEYDGPSGDNHMALDRETDVERYR
jgi:hypothetical protein